MAPGAMARIDFDVYGLDNGMPATYRVQVENIGTPTPDVAPMNNDASNSFMLRRLVEMTYNT